MKRLAWLLVFGALAYLGYIYFVRTTSPQEAQVRDLEREFRRATDRYISAMRQGGEPGLVILADPETAERMVKDVRPKLQELMKKLTHEKAIARAKELENRIQSFLERHQIE
jgi:succinate dehydrogenase/fumarate reductase flavoprotein subunit